MTALSSVVATVSGGCREGVDLDREPSGRTGKALTHAQPEFLEKVPDREPNRERDRERRIAQWAPDQRGGP